MNPRHSGTSNVNLDEGDEVLRVLSQLLAVRTWDKMHALLENEQDLLLSDTVDQRLAIGLEQAKEAKAEDAVKRFELLLNLLRRCREIGMGPAMEEFEMPLLETKADDPQAILKVFIEITDATMMPGQRWSHYREPRAILDREQDILLTDTADRIVAYFMEGMPEKEGWGMGINEESRLEMYAPYRTLFHRARQIGINKAWEEFVKVKLGKDWRWVNLFELFEEWIRISVQGEDGDELAQLKGGAFWRGKRRGRSFLEAHPELLDPEFEAHLAAEIASIDWEGLAKQDLNYRGTFNGGEDLHDISSKLPVVAAPRFRELRIVDYLDGQTLLGDASRRGGTRETIRDAYVNAYGGFVLDLPQWIEDVLEQLGSLYQSEERFQTAPARVSLLRDALVRASTDPEMDVAPEIICTLMVELCSVLEEEGYSEDIYWQETRIEAYTDCLVTYNREHYPYQWALLEAYLGNTYRHYAGGDPDDNLEKAIQCYESALQVITRNIYNKDSDRTQNNEYWALLQGTLAIAYRQRRVGDRIDNLACAIKCYEALLAIPRVLFPKDHRDRQLYLAYSYCLEWIPEAKKRSNNTDSLNAYQLAHEALASARQTQAELGWREYEARGRANLLGSWPGPQEMYALDAWCLWQLGDTRGAVVALEAGRAQALAEVLAIANATLAGVCEEHSKEFIEAREKWHKELAHGSLDAIRSARSEFLSTRRAIREHCQPDFLPGEPDYRDIACAAPDQVLVYLAATRMGGLALVVPSVQGHVNPDDRGPVAIELPQLTLQRIGDWLVRQNKDRHIVGGYQFALQCRGIELLQQWIRFSDDEQEREQRLAMPLSDLPRAISASFTTLRVAVSNVVKAWRDEVDSFSGPTDAVPQRKVRELRTRLALSLKEALEQNILTPDLNWFLQEAELDHLQQDLSETFITDLRRELDRLGLSDTNQPIAFVPCGQLGMLPLHAAWARTDSYTGELIPLLETCELTYQASARSLAAARVALARLPKHGPIIAIGNPQPIKEVELEWAEAEAKTIFALAQRYKREGSQIITGVAATNDKVQTTLEFLCKESSGAWVQIASHGHADPTDPTNCYMLLSDDERLTLADLQRQRLLAGVRGFNASGCVTALGDLERAPDELSSFAAGVLQAGSPCAVATLWSVSDKAMFLLMLRFMQEWLQEPTPTPARALREAARWLRTATREQLGDLAKKGLKGLRGLALDDTTTRDTVRGVLVSTAEQQVSESGDILRIAMPDIFKRLLAHGGHIPAQLDVPYRHAIYWAAPVIYGV